MTSRSTSHRIRDAARAGACAALLLVASPSPVRAISFTLVGDGSSQLLTWASSGFRCLTFTSGQVWSVGGCITDNRGNMCWSGQNRLQVLVFLPVYSQNYTLTPCYDGWTAIDAIRDGAVPLLFTVVADAGDPDPLQMDLSITPYLSGTIDQRSGIGGNPGTITVTLEAYMSVSVNGQHVTGDTLSIQQTVSNGETIVWSPEFPGSTSNYVVVPGVAANDLIEVGVFFFRRGQGSDYGSAWGASPYGQGVALVVEAEPINVVSVAGERETESLRLAVFPNPSLNPRIHYTLPRAAQARLAVYDVTGARVATVIDRSVDAGRGEAAWDGRDARGARLAAGVYLVELVAGSERKVGKLVLLGR